MDIIGMLLCSRDTKSDLIRAFIVTVALILLPSFSLSARAQHETLTSPFILLDRNTQLRAVGAIAFPDKMMHLYYYVRIWGISGRATQKLLVFCDDVFVGSYPLPAQPLRIDGNALVFNFQTEHGSKIEFSGCTLPNSVILDAEHFQLER